LRKIIITNSERLKIIVVIVTRLAIAITLAIRDLVSGVITGRVVIEIILMVC